MERVTKHNVQKSLSSCYGMKQLTQPTQPSASDTHSSRAAPSIPVLGFRWGRGWFRFLRSADDFIARRNSVFCSAALGVAIRVPGGSPGARGGVAPWQELTLLPSAPACACSCRAHALGGLTELQARLHLMANLACTESRQSFRSCVTDF